MEDRQNTMDNLLLDLKNMCEDEGVEYEAKKEELMEEEKAVIREVAELVCQSAMKYSLPRQVVEAAMLDEVMAKGFPSGSVPLEVMGHGNQEYAAAADRIEAAKKEPFRHARLSVTLPAILRSFPSPAKTNTVRLSMYYIKTAQRHCQSSSLILVLKALDDLPAPLCTIPPIYILQVLDYFLKLTPPHGETYDVQHEELIIRIADNVIAANASLPAAIKAAAAQLTAEILYSWLQCGYLRHVMEQVSVSTELKGLLVGKVDALSELDHSLYLMECPVCYEAFGLHGAMVPYRLRCGHALCMADVKGIVAVSGCVFPCPMCRTRCSEDELVIADDMLQVINDMEGDKACTACKKFYGHAGGQCSRCSAGLDEKEAVLKDAEDREALPDLDRVRGRDGFLNPKKEKMFEKILATRPGIEDFVQALTNLEVSTMMAEQAKHILNTVATWSPPRYLLVKYHHATLYKVLDTWNLSADEDVTCDYATYRPSPTSCKFLDTVAARCRKNPTTWVPIEPPVEVRKFWGKPS